MGEVVDFLSTPDSLTDSAKFRCLVCKNTWVQNPPEDMKKVHCPQCGSTMLKYKLQ